MMDNEEKYKFSDFTTGNYKKLLPLAKKNCTLSTYANHAKIRRPVIWRHDVDFSMHRALKLARVESEEGVGATYFILLHSEFYNLMEKEISKKLNEIINLGHAIGLHFDANYYDIKEENKLEDKLRFERDLIEKLFPVKIESFCFHITNEFTISCNKPVYAGMINAYSEYYEKRVGYCSDSNGYWRFRRLEDVLREAKDDRLQVLTHPEHWQGEGMLA